VFTPQTFHFTGYGFDETENAARLRYRFDGGPELVETIRFPGARLPLDERRREALDRCLGQLHLAAGVSYYKAGVPPEIVHDPGPLPRESAAFFETFYREGLGEFAYRNGLDLSGHVRFPAGGGEMTPAADPGLPRAAVVPLGGGKDSIVALELMRGQGGPLRVVSVGGSPLIRAVAERSGLEHIQIGRELSPELFRLNERGALNGHVPITGILAFVLAAGAVLYDYDTVVMANERSASSATLKLPDGREVNHQYSKSLAFERAFGDFMGRLLPGFRYFSLLRPFSELSIARRFAAHERYFDVFSSCNRNFTQAPRHSAERWCGRCPKCRFVFLMLAPFVDRRKLTGTFGANLLDDAAQADGYDELIGRGAQKPFECVGEEEESLAAFCLLSRDPAWCGDALVARFAEEVLPGLADPDELVSRALLGAGEHRVPHEFMELLDAA